ncbi:copper-translocating P-type ATPase [Aureimonas sp. SA4125]|uniref:heavy metal translocating P-type ATPase n=1 Tax=Aureimonas sp. SA4125 TaxID=2826993 RepID=UPI001CC3E1CA|nr:heavy metal translocating P-type ATPase [Aureimonas sp. SA4125]BDA84178.1 copper-translocating P-type ATPase [Aureimonas sp. SA4125]
MSCCSDAGALDPRLIADPEQLRAEEFRHSGHRHEDGSIHYLLVAPGIHCGACIGRIEGALKSLPGVRSARVNFSTRRVLVTADATQAEPFAIVRAVESLGYAVTLGTDDAGTGADPVLAELMRALVVAGFAAANVMLLSVSVWSGAEGATRTLFQLISGVVAVPAVLYAGRPFYRSALGAIRNGHVNMDVPISLGVLLTLVMSIYEALFGGGETWFDASLTLLFFLLIGRVLDHAMRERARSGIASLGRIASRGAMRVGADGGLDYVGIEAVRPGMTLHVAVGERFPVDGVLSGGVTEADRSLATGESAPVRLGPGDPVEAGALNLLAPVTLTATADAEHSLIREMLRLMEAAEQGKAAYVRLADRAAALYAPVVHVAALLTFVGWMALTGDGHMALTAAIAVLIITCPCALALAVPVTQVVGAGILMRRGVLMRTGSAFERMAEVRQAVFDKTGTLTLPSLSVDGGQVAGEDLRRAAALARESRHPLSVAVCALARSRALPGTEASGTSETPGEGLEGTVDGKRSRLGRWDFVRVIAADDAAAERDGLWYAREGGTMIRLPVRSVLRPDALATMAVLDEAGIPRHILSGDSAEAVALTAADLGFEPARTAARLTPAAKAARIGALASTGGPVLFVGDGINDAPALGTAHVSITPADAAEVGRANADFVFTGQSLQGVGDVFRVSHAVIDCVRQNFGLAIGYNLIAVPLAVLGFVTPLVAAIAMSSSSLVVVGNALRLQWQFRRAGDAATPAGPTSATSSMATVQWAQQ